LATYSDLLKFKLFNFELLRFGKQAKKATI